MKGLPTSTLSFEQIDKTKFELVGGKGANLGELCRISDLNVPEGFCVTTEVFKEIIESNEAFRSLVKELAGLTPENRAGVSDISSKIGHLIESTPIPRELEAEITRQIDRLGPYNAYAVRSSATAEDLTGASFAGQQDTYLNIIGIESLLRHIARCWASLFTDRALIYRLQNGLGNTKVYIAVVIQKMIFSEVAGVMFTADPVSSNRKVVAIDASFGLGEAIVSGLVNTDHYTVRDGKIISKRISEKKVAVSARDEGGTMEHDIEPALRNKQTLTDDQILALEQIGRKIEKHFGAPQDIEWCFAEDTFHIVQSRPITTLFPVPQANQNENHVFVSVGHQQMMTDAMKPLGLSFYLLSTRAAMYSAGGRLFVDVAPMLASSVTREKAINTLGQFDPRIKDALLKIMSRDGFIKVEPTGQEHDATTRPAASSLDFLSLSETNPAVVYELIDFSQNSLRILKENIELKSGSELLDFIYEDIQYCKTNEFYPRSMGVIMTSINAATWINEKIESWLGEKNVADVLSQSVSNNITSEMGLELLDLADLIRPYPQIVDYLQRARDDNFLEGLDQFEGGKEVREAIYAYLGKYGMRCAGEIDITRTRWSEKPTTILPLILGNVKNFQACESKRRFEKGLQQAMDKESELLARLRQLPEGEKKARETKQMIDVIRNFSGYREYPKYNMINHYFVYRTALLKEAIALQRRGVIRDKEDIYYLSFEELREVVRTNALDYEMVTRRKQDYEFFQKLSPPRVITSDGEIVAGQYNPKSLPPNAMVGLAASSGSIEGRARVIQNLEHAYLEDGDILVTAFTDPSWTPLFVSIKGLVTEVGGLMTHGSVIAREYGLPAVVGVDAATKRIKDGQRIRVNGTEGYVELM